MADSAGSGAWREDVRTFVTVFFGILTFMKTVGFSIDHDEKNVRLYDVGINMRFDYNISEKVKLKYCNIVNKLCDQNIWPFGYFE